MSADVLAAPPVRRARAALWGLGALAVVAAVLFVTIGALDAFALIGPMRIERLGALVVVAVAVSVSTVVFQTVTENRILTPGIMGFDALYALIQTLVVFALGPAGTLGGGPAVRFAIEAGLMTAASVALFVWIFGGSRRSLHLVVLVGIVFGTFFRSITTFVQRVMDPNDYLIVTDRLFARFSAVNPDLLALSAIIVAAATAYLWHKRAELDVIGLGRDVAIALGVNHRRAVLTSLALASLLVAVATALVGPITFFGLIVANLAYDIADSRRHALTLPIACLLGIITLVGGQAILEHVLGAGAVLAVVIEFVGGLAFIFLMLKGRTR